MKILISDELKSLLKQFEQQSYVASLLLKENIEVELLTETPVDYISISSEDSSRISYLTPERISIINSEEERWYSKKRFHCKPGAFVGKLFSNISFFEVERFSNLFRAYSQKKEFDFEIVKGEEINKWYLDDNYDSMSGSLGISCMRYAQCQSYFDFYSKNSQVSMLIMKSKSGKLMGRALLWNFDENKIMDRIYTIFDEEFQYFFKQWAYENGYIHKSKQNWSNTLQFDTNSDKFVEHKFKIKLENFNFHFYPYLDTFKWLDKDGYLYNYAPCVEKYIVLSNPNGGREPKDFLEFDELGREWHNCGTLIWVKDHNLMTSDRYVNYCNYLDTYILKTESTYSQKYQDFIYLDDSKNCQEKLDLRLERISRLEKSDSLTLDWTYFRNTIIQSVEA